MNLIIYLIATLLVTLLGSIVLLADLQGSPSPLIGKVSF